MQNIKKELLVLSKNTNIDFLSLTPEQASFVICGALQENFTDEQIAVYADKKFNNGQTKELFKALKNGISVEQVNFFADRDLTEKQINKIAQVFLEKDGDKIDSKKASLFIKKELNPMQIYTLGKGVCAGLSEKDINLILDKDLSWEQMSELISGIKSEIEQKKIVLIADKNFTPEQIHELINIAKKLPVDKLGICADKNLSPEQMEEIKEVLIENKNLKRIELFKQSGITKEHIEQINLGFKNGLTATQIKLFATPDKKREDMETMRINIALESMEQAKHIKCGKNDKFERYGFKIGLNINEVSSYAGMSDEDKKYIILEGIEKGLPTPLYADDRFSADIMKEIKESLEDGVSENFIKENITTDMSIKEVTKILNDKKLLA